MKLFTFLKNRTVQVLQWTVLSIVGLIALGWRIYDLLDEGMHDRYTASRFGLKLEGAGAITLEFIIICLNLVFLSVINVLAIGGKA